MFRRILLASDASEHALHAAEKAARLARENDACLTILYVYTPMARVTPFGPVSTIDLDPEVIQSVQKSVTDRTAAVVRRFEVPFNIRTEIGYAADIIVGVAAEDEYDLIVIGCRGHSGIASLLMGNVADRVCHTAHCAVLVVK